MSGFDDLAEDELAAIVSAPRQTIDHDRYPLSPRLKPFKGALAKLDPGSVPKTRVERPPLTRSANAVPWRSSDAPMIHMPSWMRSRRLQCNRADCAVADAKAERLLSGSQSGPCRWG